MTIIDELNARIERGKASDREAAKLAGMTIEEYDTDTTAVDCPSFSEDYCNFYADGTCTLSEDKDVGCHASIDYCPLAGPDGELAELRRMCNVNTISFQTFVHSASILLDREPFHTFVVAEVGPKAEMAYAEWLDLWARYCDIEAARLDAQDEAETQADALV
jgi:hypothetical protein